MSIWKHNKCLNSSCVHSVLIRTVVPYLTTMATTMESRAIHLYSNTLFVFASLCLWAWVERQVNEVIDKKIKKMWKCVARLWWVGKRGKRDQKDGEWDRRSDKTQRKKERCVFLHLSLWLVSVLLKENTVNWHCLFLPVPPPTVCSPLSTAKSNMSVCQELILQSDLW